MPTKIPNKNIIGKCSKTGFFIRYIARTTRIPYWSTNQYPNTNRIYRVPYLGRVLSGTLGKDCTISRTYSFRDVYYNLDFYSDVTTNVGGMGGNVLSRYFNYKCKEDNPYVLGKFLPETTTGEIYAIYPYKCGSEFPDSKAR